MQVSELDALDTGQRIRVMIDDTRHQTWVKDGEVWRRNNLTAYSHTFTAPLAADRVEVITPAEMVWEDLPKYRLAPTWLDHPTRATWARNLRGTVFAGVPYHLRAENSSGYGADYTALISKEATETSAFTEVGSEHIRAFGLPPSLEGMYFRFFRNRAVEELTEREALLAALPTRRWSRALALDNGGHVADWFGDQEHVDLAYAPVTAGTYTFIVVAPEGQQGAFVIEENLCAEYGVPEELVGMWGCWARDRHIAPTEEEIAERTAARERQAAWFAGQPQYRVPSGRLNSRFPREEVTVMAVEAAPPRSSRWIGVLAPEGTSPRDWGFWEVTEARQQEFHLPLETVGMWGYWYERNDLVLADPLSEWLASLPRARFTGDENRPAGDYMETQPEVAYVETGGAGEEGGILFAEGERARSWSFWDDRRFRRHVPEHLRDEVGVRLFGWWVNPGQVDMVLTPEQMEERVQARITEAVEQVRAEMQHLANSNGAAADRLRVQMERLAVALRTMLDDHDYDYGCEQDELLEEAGYPREAPRENIWVEVKVTGEGEYEVDDSVIESAYDHDISTERSTYSVSFDWERELRIESIEVESGTCVCGDDPDDVIGDEYIRERLSGLNLPGHSRDWAFEIVNCENG